MHKMLAAFSLALLVGCAGTIQDRLDGGVKASVTTDKTPQEYVDCLRAEWVKYGNPNILNMEQGLRYLLVGGSHVEAMVDVTGGEPLTTVEFYYRPNIFYPHARMIQELENCAQ